jgi:capsular polysaccharide transport system permease protein
MRDAPLSPAPKDETHATGAGPRSVPGQVPQSDAGPHTDLPLARVRAFARLVKGEAPEAARKAEPPDRHGAAGDADPPAQAPGRAETAAPREPDRIEAKDARKSRISPRPTRDDDAREASPEGPGSTEAGTGKRPRQIALSRRALLAASFAICVAVPLALAALYLTQIARPQYASTVAFTVRADESGAMSEALTGIAQVAGAPRSADTAILAEFLESQTLVERLDGRLDIVRHYSEPWPHDPAFALDPETTVEGLLAHWRRKVRVTHDAATGLLEVRVLAFSPEMAQLVARELLVEGQSLVNDLNSSARNEAAARTAGTLSSARERLAEARTALTEFRTRSGIVDPQSDLEGRLGVLRHLQGQLAQAMVQDDMRPGGPTDPGSRRIAALRDRIEAERSALLEARGTAHAAGGYPHLLAEYERLVAERNLAREAYRRALAAHDATLAQAARQDRFLAVYEQPTLAGRSDFPRTGAILGLAALFLGLGWAVLVLMHAAMRDRR